jgi:hypothetical protein
VKREPEEYDGMAVTLAVLLAILVGLAFAYVGR